MAAAMTSPPSLHARTFDLLPTSSQLVTTAASTFAPDAASTMDLPDLPIWFLYAFAGACSFILIFAAVLLLVQFPERLIWAEERMSQRRRRRYERLADVEMELGDMAGKSSSFNPTHSQDVQLAIDVPRITKRARPSLSIDTTGKCYVGLGIVMPGEENDATPTFRPARVRTAWTTTSLTPYPRSPLRTKLYIQSPDVLDIEKWTPRLFTPMTSNSIGIGGDDHHNGEHEQQGSFGSTFAKRLDDAIVCVTDRLARQFHHQVKGAEEGLLLPVREEEREWIGALEEGVVVV